MYHLLSEHSQAAGSGPENEAFPKIPPQMVVDMFVHSDEEAFLKISQAATREYRELHHLQNSDEIEEVKEELKQERAATVTVIEPKGKQRRKSVVEFIDKINCDRPVTTHVHVGIPPTSLISPDA